MLRLLIAYPGVSAIQRAQIQGINTIKGISWLKPKKIKQLAKESVSASSDEFEEVMVKTLAQDIQYHQNRIDQLKDQLIASAKNDQTDLICSIRGIADWTLFRSSCYWVMYPVLKARINWLVFLGFIPDSSRVAMVNGVYDEQAG